jgi:hypothetical protein
VSAGARLDDTLVALAREFQGAGLTIRWGGKPNGDGAAWVTVSCNGIMGAGETVGEAVQTMLPELIADADRKRAVQAVRLDRMVELSRALFPKGEKGR